MTLTRRTFLAASGAVSLTAVLASCAGFSKPATSSAEGTLTFTTWGTDAELKGFRDQISRFEKANAGATIDLNAVPYEQMFTNIDAQLQAGNPPDVFRVPYYTFGSYAGRGQLLDLSDQLPGDFGDRFTRGAWAAVQNEGKPFGVPHHTDTTAILYNKTMLEAAGITDVPTSVEDAWTWDQFDEVAATLRANLPADRYPFAYNWQGNGVTRWLTWLFEADGRFLDENLTDPAIDSDAGRKAVDFTRSFFEKQYVPQNDSIKSATYAQDSWYSQTTAMVFSGAFSIPDATDTLDFEWGATFAPRDERSASDFGGNALVVTKDAADPALAAAFLDFVTQEDAMRAFCEGASLLPTRQDLIDGGIEFDVRPELSPVFIGQAGTVQASDSSQVASPDMAAIITVLQDELEQAFVGGQSTDDTLSRISDGIAAATGA
ncbi:extracellular solute-binding protein [Frigoribacterium sp. VKM Ac-1396]|uniref:ABC transporter substrate-binding protein n=1 Tax=Frigoribacterium sp. VKM Ac-1396 TaxID=2783821 RepID=UPI00188B7BAD|nr:extracellular solute-binding protein [Frigoribacterium sp. VKM Ac-1396]MBF4601812.1 extracellular solute-binding protein [Frigoribacterium sp. VKM Ac-1396]